ncbi:MAG: cytochrome c biogenesis CcdA family protein [Acidimicrobiales bacterium]|nr:cytochrome c biogenesis CcdA family protein [Acidimicrobiales bacterium]
MIDAPLALAFAAGLVAAVNPCGFAMLPAYVGFFLGREGDRVPTRSESVLRSIPVAASVSLGFLVVFGAVGVLLQPISSTIQEYAPWATIVIGTGVAVLGIAVIAGFELTARMPKIDRGGHSQGLGSMFLYGVSYAVASLTCTIGIFLSVVVGTFSRTNFISGVSMLLLYAAGMSLVITFLTVAIALARDSVVRFMRTGMQYVNRLAGALMIVAGAYVAWYGVVSLRVRDGGGTGQAVDLVEEWSARASQFVNDAGATRLGLILVGIIVAMVCISVIISSVRGEDDRPGDETPSTGSPTGTPPANEQVAH